jgi:PIN domain nuclease of toxin-antitoxin system
LKLLLDTHVLLWWLLNDTKLPPGWVSEIRSSSETYVSTSSVWEIAIKEQVGKLKAPDNLRERLVANQFSVLPIHLDHLAKYRDLPLHHTDPFDRMLIAQAQAEDLVVISADPKFRLYEVELLAP